ncbi:hypothetical protein EDB85DRAFT_1904592 [Lactarius pseudohatsudake]|nr:hypothetical protein EDB85DRAFT_1904592 [Lactarius pseudohatsudake]
MARASHGSGPSHITKPTAKYQAKKGPTSKSKATRAVLKRKWAANTTDDSRDRSDQDDDSNVGAQRSWRKKPKPRNKESSEESTGASKPKGKGKKKAVTVVIEVVDEEELDDETELEIIDNIEDSDGPKEEDLNEHLVLGKFGLRPTQTGFEPNPNRFKWFGFGESWLKLNGLVSGLGVPNLVQTEPNRLRKHIKK